MNAILEQINSAGLKFVEFALPMFVQSVVLIVILLLADFALRKKVRAVFRYWIWLLVLLKLVLPTSLSSPMSLGYFFGNRLTYVDTTETPPEPQTNVVQPVLASVPPFIDLTDIEADRFTPAAPPIIPETEPAVTSPDDTPVISVTPLSWQGAVFLTWLTVVIAMVLLLLQRAIFVRGLVAQAKEANGFMADMLESCRSAMSVKRKLGLKISANAASPAVCGLFSPVILVPQNLASSLTAGQLRAVLLHELAHIRRGDLFVNLAQTVLQIFYFYNPLLWLANCIIRRIREQAVDEMVLVAMGEKATQYPQTLVSVAKLAFKRPVLSLRLIGVVESKSALSGRIKHILNRPLPKKAKLGIIGLLVVIVTGAILLPMASSMPGPPGLVIKGVVKDAQTGEPIAGARVFDDGYGPEPVWEQIKADKRSEWGAITNSAGQYSFLTWPEHHSIKIEAPGYKPQRRNLYKSHFVFKTKDEEVFNFALKGLLIKFKEINEGKVEKVSLDDTTVWSKSYEVKFTPNEDMLAAAEVYVAGEPMWIPGRKIFEGSNKSEKLTLTFVRNYKNNERTMITYSIKFQLGHEIFRIPEFPVHTTRYFSGDLCDWFRGETSRSLKTRSYTGLEPLFRYCATGQVKETEDQAKFWVPGSNATPIMSNHCVVLRMIPLSRLKNLYLEPIGGYQGLDGKIMPSTNFTLEKADEIADTYKNMIGEHISPQQLENDYTATLPNGVTVELIGLCEHPSQGKQWWRPDGSILHQKPYGTIKGDRIFFDTDEKAYEFVVRFRGPDDVDIEWRKMPDSGSLKMTSFPYGSDGKLLSDMRVLITKFHKTDRLAHIRIGIVQKVPDESVAQDEAWVDFKDISLQPGVKTDVQVDVTGGSSEIRVPVAMVGTWYFENPNGDDEQMSIFPVPDGLGRVVGLYSNGHRDESRYTNGFIESSEHNNAQYKMTLEADGTLVQYFDSGGSLLIGKRWKRIDPQPSTDLLRVLTGPNSGKKAVDSDELSGRVVDETGNPIADAQVAISTEKIGVKISNSKLLPMRRGDIESKIIRTDSLGRFNFGQKLSDIFNLIVAHEKGFAQVSSEDITAPYEIRIQPWGRIKGQLAQGRKAAGDTIALSSLPNSTWFVRRSECRYETKCDTAGNFIFDKLPYGWFEVGYLVSVGEASASITCRTPVEVEAGRTAELILGGSGRPIVGKFVPPPGYNMPIYFGSGLRALDTVRPERPYPENYNQMTKRQQQQWYKQWRKTDEYKKYRDAVWLDKNRRQYTFKINKDGSFRIEDVIAGEYNLTVLIEERLTGQGWPEEIAGYHGTIEVQDIPGGRSEEPLDLGELELTMHNPLRVGDIAPLFEAKTLSGENLKLTDYRGKFVLLSFWQPVSHPELQQLKELYDTYSNKGRIEIIGLGGTDTLDEVRNYVKENAIPWPQIYTGEEYKSGIAKDYGGYGIFLIDPDGRVVAKNLRDEKLMSTVIEILNAANQNKTDLQVVAEKRKAEISGFVEDENGIPIAGASVTLLNKDLALLPKPERFDQTMRMVVFDHFYDITDTNGRFEFLDFNPGKTDIIVESQGYRTEILRDITTGTKNLKITLGKPSAYTLAGEVVDGKGNPISSVEITLAEESYKTVRTDEKGGFQFAEKLEPTTVHRARALFARKEGFGIWGKKLDTTGGETYVKITLLPEEKISGRVVDKIGEPITNATILFWSCLGRDTRFSFSSKWKEIAPLVEADPNGRFTLTGIPTESDVFLRASAPGYASSGLYSVKTGEFGSYAVMNEERGTIEVYGSNHEPAETVEFKLQKAVTLIGTLAYEGSGRPAPGLRVATQSHKTSHSVETWTDQAGRFKLEGVSPNPCNLLVVQDDSEKDSLPEWTAAAIQFDDLQEGETRSDIRLVLTKGGIIRGKVIDVEGNPLHGIDIAFYSAARPRPGAACQSINTAKDGSWAYRFPPGDVFVYIRTKVPEGSWSRKIYNLHLNDGREVEDIDFELNRVLPENSPYRREIALKTDLQVEGKKKKPPVWLALLPRSPIRSAKELYLYFWGSPLVSDQTKIDSFELEIRSARDNVRMARINGKSMVTVNTSKGEVIQWSMFRDGLRENMNRRIGPLEDGEYLIAIHVNGIRCSNVAKFTVDSSFDSSNEPTLQVVPLVPAPGEKLQYFGLRATGPTPQDSELTNMALHFPDIIVDGVPRKILARAWSGPVYPLKPGQQHEEILLLKYYKPEIDLSRKHTVKVIIGKYESAPVEIGFDHSLELAWDEATTTIKSRPPRPPVLEGRVIGPDGKPGIGYRVCLYADPGRNQCIEYSDKDGKYDFPNVPTGKYKLTCQPRGNSEPALTFEQFQIEANKTVVQELSLEGKYAFSGKVTYEDGSPAAGVKIVGRWERGGNVFRDLRVTDENGYYELTAPFELARYICLSIFTPDGTPAQGSYEHVRVMGPRTDVDFVVKRREIHAAIWPKKFARMGGNHPDFQPVSVPEGWDYLRLLQALYKHLETQCKAKLPDCRATLKDEVIKLSFNTREYNIIRPGNAKRTGMQRNNDRGIGPEPDGLILTVHFSKTAGQFDRPYIIDRSPWTGFISQVYLPDIKLYLNVDIQYGTGINEKLLTDLCAPNSWLKTIFKNFNEKNLE